LSVCKLAVESAEVGQKRVIRLAPFIPPWGRQLPEIRNFLISCVFRHSEPRNACPGTRLNHAVMAYYAGRKPPGREIVVTSPFVVAPSQAGRPLDVVGEKITVLASGRQTGSYEVFLQDGPEGSGPPPHSHPWDEAFYVTKGEITFGVGDSETVAVPGTFVHLPAGTTHWFRFGRGGGQMVSLTSREGASHLFAELDHAISPDKPDLGKLVEVGSRYGLKVSI
jgi:quercetin dioxygenase-like cupin family protein